MKPETKTYNGWKNRATWDVALWLNNEEPLYRAMVAFAKGSRDAKRIITYRRLIYSLGLQRERTPDGTAWLARSLDYRRLSEMVREVLD